MLVVVLAIDLFNETLPHKPYYADDLSYGVRIASKARALRAQHIQPNPVHAQHWLVFDVDRAGAAIDWSDRNAPTPNLTVMNPANAHAHLLYALETPIRTTPDGSLKALKYAAAIERGIGSKLAADPGYSGLICKNPNHSTWNTYEWRPQPYTLDELADYVDLRAANHATFNETAGLGRNCDLFEKSRQWAYRAIRDYHRFPFEQWSGACLQYIEAQNMNFPQPLSFPECKAIASSVSKWTWTHITPDGFSEVQAQRGRKGGTVSKRSAVSDSARTLKPWEEMGVSRATFYRRLRETR